MAHIALHGERQRFRQEALTTAGLQPVFTSATTAAEKRRVSDTGLTLSKTDPALFMRM
jgi:hypothetical protein